MPVYNGQKYLKESIESILNQTYKNFEFLIINDGSTDKSKEIIEEYKKKDKRIKYVENEKNLGLIATLNKGLVLAQGKYLARMDCDDISLPKRLEKQVRFMEKNPEVGVCGTWIKFFGQAPSVVVKNPSLHNEIRCKLLFTNPIAHPTVMLRKEFFDKFKLKYENFKAAEDFELWQRCGALFKLHNLPETLLNYRISETSITQTNKDQIAQTVKAVFQLGLEVLGLRVDDADLDLHMMIGNEVSIDELAKIKQIGEYLKKLSAKNHQNNIYPKNDFDKLIAEYWFVLCTKYTGNYREVFDAYIEAPFRKNIAVWYFLYRFEYVSMRHKVFKMLSKIKRKILKKSI